MATREIEVNDLSDVDISTVSMVKHAASRLPFKATKGDDGMIDLSKITKSDGAKTKTPGVKIVAKIKADAPAPTAVTADPTDPKVALAAAQKTLEDAGYTVMVASPPDTVATPNAATAGAADKAAAVSGVKKTDEEIAKEIEMTTAKDKKTAEIEVMKAELAKAEAELVAITKDKKPEVTTAQNDPNTGKNKEAKDGKGVEEADDGSGVDDDEEISNDPTVQNGKTIGTTGAGGKETFAMLKKMAEEQAAMLKAMTEAMTKGLKDINDRVSTVETSVKKSAATIAETVLGSAPGDDDNRTVVKKSASRVSPLLDTAYSHREAA
jgi:hypothetical protein